MDSSNISHGKPFDCSEANVQKLKDKYSQEMKDRDDNPIKVCMRLVFNGAIEKDPSRRSNLALELSKFLTDPNGVINLFLALIDFDTSSQKLTTHNQRFMAIANIITRLPKLCMPYEEYCKNITKQLMPLLISYQPNYSSIACIIVQSMIESPHAKNKHVEKIILSPIFDALSITNCPVLKPHEAIIAIFNLIRCHISIQFFVNLFPNIFYALIMLIGTPSRLKPLLRSTIISILNGLSPGVACCLLEKTLFHSHKTKSLYTMNAGESEITIKVTDSSDIEPSHLITNEQIEKTLIHLLEDCNNESLILEFFFHFQATMWTADEDKNRKLSASIIEPLLQQTVAEGLTKLDLLGIIASNSDRSLDSIVRTLLNYVAFLRTGRNQDITATKKLISSSIDSCFNLLEVLSATLRTVKDKKSMGRKFLPVLKQIQELLDTKDKQHETDKDVNRNLRSLINMFEKDSGISAYSPEPINFTDEKFEREFYNIIKDLNDKLVPVRVHALVRLKQMILANDQNAVSRIPQIYTMIEAFLADREPYVFLACINLTAEMAIRKTGEILPKLVELYSEQSLNIQHRMNVGEVLVRLTKQMNATAPYYAQQVMNMMFIGCKDNEELMRMSSLTNIGEICHNLGDSLGNYMVEILSCIRTVIDSDAIPVKCAAIDLLRTTLSGLDKSKVESIQRELKSIYDLLKKLKYRTLDEKLCLQVDLALGEVDRLAREMLGVTR